MPGSKDQRTENSPSHEKKDAPRACVPPSPAAPQTGEATLWRVHEPVLLKEVLHWLNPQPGETIADLTVGNAGHFLEILRRLDGRGLAIGVDADPEMLEVARRRIEAAGDLPPTPWMLIHSNFSAVDDILRAAGVQALDGVLMDLGLNSMQLQADRGLSHQVDGPLDFRFDRTQGRPAAEWINSAPEEELAQVFRDLGDERRWARAMARAIVRRRAERPIERTLELAAILTRAIPPRWRTTRRPPAARAFLAIRAHINRELPSLKTALEELIPRLAPGGRLLVIAFNGNEDRVVKQAFRRVALSRRELREREAGRGRTGGPAYRLIGTRPIYPSEEEIAANPRARPARLRGLIREKDYDGEKDYEGKD